MSKCKECTKYKTCAKRELFGSLGCNNDFQQKNYTQADKIRSMSDKELKEFLLDFDGDMWNSDGLLEYLQSEVSE